jgi:hypothetical protein
MILMSWNVNLTDIDPTEIGKLAHDAYEEFKARYSDDADAIAAMDEQFDAVLAAASSGLTHVVGDGNVNVTLSGHANPGHQPRQGWANDLVTVSISSAARLQE